MAFKERLGDSEIRISTLFFFFGCDDMLYLVGELTISDPVLEAAGEINKVTWTVDSENGAVIDDFPDSIKGGHYLRKWVENKGYYGKLYTIGSNNLQPLTITWNGLTLEKAQQIFSYYMKRKHVIADYREFSGKLARIADMRFKPFWGSDFVGVTVTIVEVPAFRVYRSTDYGESYQQASDRVNNEFYDYGFVYAGQVRYRIQYDPPDASSTFDGIETFETHQTTRISRAKPKPLTAYAPPSTNIAGAMKLSDIFITNDPTDIQDPVITNQTWDYRPTPEMTVEGVWWYSAEGLTPAIKVTLNYPRNAFSTYPTTVITKEHIEGTAHGTAVDKDGMNPFYFFLEDGIGVKTYDFTAWSRNVYGCSLPSYVNGTVTIPDPPYYDKWFVQPTGIVKNQNSDYTYVNHNNRFEDVYTPPYDEVYPTEIAAENEYHEPVLPPEYNELDGGTYSDVFTELEYKNVYAGEVTQESDYSEIHYT